MIGDFPSSPSSQSETNSSPSPASTSVSQGGINSHSLVPLRPLPQLPQRSRPSNPDSSAFQRMVTNLRDSASQENADLLHLLQRPASSLESPDNTGIFSNPQPQQVGDAPHPRQDSQSMDYPDLRLPSPVLPVPQTHDADQSSSTDQVHLRQRLECPLCGETMMRCMTCAKRAAAHGEEKEVMSCSRIVNKDRCGFFTVPSRCGGRMRPVYSSDQGYKGRKSRFIEHLEEVEKGVSGSIVCDEETRRSSAGQSWETTSSPYRSDLGKDEQGQSVGSSEDEKQPLVRMRGSSVEESEPLPKRVIRKTASVVLEAGLRIKERWVSWSDWRLRRARKYHRDLENGDFGDFEETSSGGLWPVTRGGKPRIRTLRR
ncbi:hypothetical protein ACLMJK_007715 [Lecanora helva]